MGYPCELMTFARPTAGTGSGRYIAFVETGSDRSKAGGTG